MKKERINMIMSISPNIFWPGLFLDIGYTQHTSRSFACFEMSIFHEFPKSTKIMKNTYVEEVRSWKHDL